MSTDQLATLRQTLPRLVRVMKRMRPTYHVGSVAEINRAFLERRGIRGVLWDIDGTLMRYHASDIDPAFQHVRTMFRNGPGRHGILSNCDERRFEALGEMFPEVPIVRGYATTGGDVFRHTLGGQDTHSHDEIQQLLASGGRQIRKPSGELVRHGMELLGEADPKTVLMVGDQYLTDIASANLAGAQSVKVPTFRPESFPRAIRATQLLEGMVYRVLYGRGK